jgi:hypothetical protein
MKVHTHARPNLSTHERKAPIQQFNGKEGGFIVTFFIYIINVGVRGSLHASRLIPRALKLMTM